MQRFCPRKGDVYLLMAYINRQEEHHKRRSNFRCSASFESNTTIGIFLNGPSERRFPGLSEHRAPLGRLDPLAATAINIRPLRPTGARPSLSARMGAKPSLSAYLIGSGALKGLAAAIGSGGAHILYCPNEGRSSPDGKD
jgi:hypothetical protein